MNSLSKNIAMVAALITGSAAVAQYAPGVGNPGTSAIYKDSSVFVSWASECNVVRGWQDISNTSLGVTNVGDSSMVLDVAGNNGVVSLGDGGYATASFQNPIGDGPGWDFAVFENSFDDAFLELAFVEVSSDGENFFRFPAHSLTDTSVQTGSFGSTDPTKINNLAGKYRAFYGTPFDLSELSSIPGLNIQQITHVRVIDVIGNLNGQYCSRDTANNPVNDPWPTAFGSGGFDLDAIGVIYENPVTINEIASMVVTIFPNPTASGTATNFWFSEVAVGEQVMVLSASGSVVINHEIASVNQRISTEGLKPGLYFVCVVGEATHSSLRWVITE